MKITKGEEVKERTMLRYSKSHVFSAVTMGVATLATAAVFYFRGCETQVEKPMAVRGDRVCVVAVEAYPYMRDIRTGRVVLDSAGKPVPNPNYSKEDCHRGDGVPDVGADKASLRDPAGNPVKDFMDTYTDKSSISLPLEDENSLDVVLKKIADQPCGEVDGKHPVLTRDKINLPELMKDGNLRKRFRTQEEIEKLHAQPGLFDKEGGDMYTVVVDYVETCDITLPPCTPLSFEACFCANLPECQEGPCGNGTIDKDKGEQCDPKSGKKNGGCKEGSHCERCQCISNKPKPTCNNGVFDRGKEDCDGSSTLARGGCGEGYHCVKCECKQDEAPDNCTPLKRCGTDVKVGKLAGRVLSGVNEGDLRQKCAGDIMLSAQFRVSPSGVPSQIGTISATCDEKPLVKLGEANLDGVTFGSLGGECDCLVTVSPPLAKAGNSG